MCVCVCVCVCENFLQLLFMDIHNPCYYNSHFQMAEICYFNSSFKFNTTDAILFGSPMNQGMNLTINGSMVPFHVNYTVTVSACNVYGCNSSDPSITLSKLL